MSEKSLRKALQKKANEEYHMTFINATQIGIDNAVEIFKQHQVEELIALWDEIKNWIQRYNVENYPFSSKRVETLSAGLVETIFNRKKKELLEDLGAKEK